MNSRPFCCLLLVVLAWVHRLSIFILGYAQWIKLSSVSIRSAYIHVHVLQMHWFIHSVIRSTHPFPLQVQLFPMPFSPASKPKVPCADGHQRQAKKGLRIFMENASGCFGNVLWSLRDKCICLWLPWFDFLYIHYTYSKNHVSFWMEFSLNSLFRVVYADG